MAEETANEGEVNPKYARLIHAMMELVGALQQFENPKETIKFWTEKELAQSFSYFLAVVRGFAPWFTAFRKERKRRKKELEEEEKQRRKEERKGRKER